jgi:Zn-dependent protease
MIFTLFSSPILFLFTLITIVVSIAIHEFAHAITADKLGDPTPRLQGRITLNPLKHLDLFGTLFILIAGFGWGKPVEYDPFNLDNPRRDGAIIALAGPISNFILAILASITGQVLLANEILSPLISSFLFVFILLNISLGVFNLIPVNPLDGFKIVAGILPSEQAHQWYGLERYGFIFLLMLILPLGPNGSSMVDMILRPIINFVGSVLLPQSPLM